MIGAGVAVVLVISGVALLIAIRGHSADGDVAGQDAAVQQARTGEPRATPSAPAASTSPAPLLTPSVAPAPQPTAPIAAKPLPRAPLTVLNNSTIDGLGADSAARFRAAGWTIAEVGGLRGRYRHNTVYYEPGQLEAARLLMRQFPAINAIEPRSSVPRLPGTGLTVVVTRDFP